MNLDLLKKLTRLANHNPNDNEANLAARKVCKILEEGNWSFPSIKINPVQTWNDVKRSTEPAWKSTPFSGIPFDDLFRNFHFSGFKPADEYNQSYNQQQAAYAEQERIRKKQVEWDLGYAARRDAKKKAEERRKQPKRPLDCCRCKKSFMTGFQGPIEIFKCHNCYWEEYRENK